MKNKFLLSPFIIFSAIFILEKIFLLPAVREYTQNWTKFEPYIYESREDLFLQLEKEYKDRLSRNERPGFVFGTSRAGEIAEDNFGKKGEDLYIYNFSTPLASYPQHYYWMEKIIDAGIKPEFVVVETDFIMFTETAMQYTLAYSLDSAFVIRETDFFGAIKSRGNNPEDLFQENTPGFEYRLSEKYFLKKMFALYRYPLDLKSVSQNRKEQAPGMTGIDINRKARELIAASNRENLGGMKNTFLLARIPENRIKLDVEDKFAKFGLHSYSPSQTQILFFNKILEILAANQIPVILFRPILSGPFNEKLSQYSIVDQADKIQDEALERYRKKYPGFAVTVFDPGADPEIKCRKFMDATHLSAGCSGEVIKSLKKSIELVKNKK